MITLIDFGGSNLRSVQKAFDFLGRKVQITADKTAIENASVLVFPGQGAFKTAMDFVTTSRLAPLIRRHILAKKPYLGICLGFQVLFESSDENGHCAGLGIFPGHVRRLNVQQLKIPHMGWNTILPPKKSLFNDMSEDYVYFVHSYALMDVTEDVLATRTTYGQSFISAVETDTVLATQFHPEKSGGVGLKMLERFLNRCQS